MSQVSTAVNHAATLDWNVVAAAAATFVGTVIITVWGWFQGKKKLQDKLDRMTTPDLGGGTITGAVLLDNLTIREATLVNREVRDQLLLHTHALSANTRAVEDSTNTYDELISEVRLFRKSVDNLPHRP